MYIYHKYILINYLKRLGFSIAASNISTIKDFELLKKYAEQVVNCSRNSFTTEERNNIIKTFTRLKLL